MSKRPSTLANAKKGSEIRKSGYATGIHAMPEYKAFIDEEYQKGGKSVRTIYAEAKKKWGAKNIPSQAATYTYIKNYLNKKVETVKAYVPEYSEVIRKFDVYVKSVELAEEYWKRYEKFRTKEERVGVPMVLIQKELENYGNALKMVFDMEVKLGLRQGLPDNINLSQFNITNNGPVADMEKLDESAVENLDQLIAFRQQIDSYREQRAEEPIDLDAEVNTDGFSIVQSGDSRF